MLFSCFNIDVSVFIFGKKLRRAYVIMLYTCRIKNKVILSYLIMYNVQDCRYFFDNAVHIDSPSVARGLRYFSTLERQIKNVNHSPYGLWLKY
jgi:abortive infection bacteriophage resistance protein